MQTKPSLAELLSSSGCHTAETALGWASLLALLLTPLLPGFQTECNVAAGIGLALLAIHWKRGNPTLIPSRWLLGCIALYFLSSVISTVVPAALRDDSYMRMALSANSLWHSIRALTAAGLCLHLIRKREDLLTLLSLFLLVYLVINLWAPIDHWLRGGFFIRSDDLSVTRMDGSKGNSARFAQVLFLLSFLVWMLMLAPKLQKLQLPRWAKWAGFVVAVILPFALLFNKELLDLGPPSGWIPGGLRKRGAWNYSFYALCGILIVIGTMLWYGFVRFPKKRVFFVLGGLILTVVGINFTLTRLPLGILFLAGFIILLLRGGKLTKIGIPLLLIGVIGIAFWFRAHPGTLLNKDSLQQRANFWSGACELIELNPLFGIGYGNDAAHEEWLRHFGLYDTGRKHIVGGYYFPLSPRYYIVPFHGERLLTHAQHVHNMWLQLLLERGIVGLIAFHLLWISTIVLLFCQRHPDAESRRIARIAAIFLLFLILNGLLEHPVRKTDEILYWLVPALGFAALRFSSPECKEKESGQTPACDCAEVS